MLILSHRGYWKTVGEQNQLTAFERSYSLGFGTETDIRDYRGTLVISHDVADEKCLSLDAFLSLYQSLGSNMQLALNIKADGLQLRLRHAMDTYEIRNYFVFDFSIPDGVQYLSSGLSIFARQSEYEPQPCFYEQAIGVWMDGFNHDWMNESNIAKHLNTGKQVCIVSPELHNRPYLPLWERLSLMPFVTDERLMLCTDYPMQAKELFNA